MKTNRSARAASLVFFGFAAVAISTVAKISRADDAKADRLEALSWLSGHWRGKLDQAEFEAIYSSPEGGLILSINKSFVSGKVDFFEFEEIRVLGEDVVLSPHPMGKKAPEFKLSQSKDSSVKCAVFVNPGNAFPSEIRYEMASNGHLVIDVKGTREGKPEVMRFDLSPRDRARSGE